MLRQGVYGFDAPKKVLLVKAWGAVSNKNCIINYWKHADICKYVCNNRFVNNNKRNNE
jgi:hypothetical protein